ncbi:MAG TPA: hypothetical protein VGM78_12860, partial [Ilumatobacteraceae bacterium]
MLNRRQFLGIVGGVTVVGLAACSSDTPAAGSGSPSSTPTTGANAVGTGAPASPTVGSAGEAPGTTTAAAAGHRRVLVIVQLMGGNDGLNTLIPTAGAYMDARPTLAIPEAKRIALAGRTDFALHPSLAPLAPLWSANQLAFVESVGFADQNRSHFVALDQWWRADDLSATSGWLGNYLAAQSNTDPLFATALNAGAPLLLNATNQAAVIYQPAAFKFSKAINGSLLSSMTAPPSSDPIQAAAQQALARSITAVSDFTKVLAIPDSTDDGTGSDREGGATLADGLATAAKLVTGDPNTQIVIVSAAGFDTHSGQLDTQAALFTDLAQG